MCATIIMYAMIICPVTVRAKWAIILLLRYYFVALDINYILTIVEIIILIGRYDV